MLVLPQKGDKLKTWKEENILRPSIKLWRRKMNKTVAIPEKKIWRR